MRYLTARNVSTVMLGPFVTEKSFRNKRLALSYVNTYTHAHMNAYTHTHTHKHTADAGAYFYV